MPHPPAFGASGAPASPAGAALAAWARTARCPAANLAISLHGRIIDTAGWGPRTPQARAPIWSLSKSITAACVAHLVDEGRASLHAPIGALLRGLRPATAAITAAELITHRSGLPGKTGFGPLTDAVAALLVSRPPDQVTFADIAPAMRHLVPTEPPGAGFTYSNLNYFLLGQLIEAAAGQPYVAACNARILAPAGIQGAGLDPRWGGLLWSTGGWMLSPAEYLAFAATLAPGGDAGPSARAFLQAIPARGATARDPQRNYTLGMIWQPTPTGPMMIHNGSWSWQQPGADPALHEAAGSQFRRWPEGMAWCATFDGISSDRNPEEYAALATAIGRLRGSYA